MNLIILLIGLLLPWTAKSEVSQINNNKTEIAVEIVRAAKYEGVPPLLLLAVCYTESTFFKYAPKMDGNSMSHGICQVKLETAHFMDKVDPGNDKATFKSLQIPYVNALYAAKYLKYQMSRYPISLDLAIDAYNKGTAVSKSSRYVQTVKLNLIYVRKCWGLLVI